MKAARLVVLGVAIAAGGLAALLAGGGSDEPAPAPAPVAQLDTVDVLIAQRDIGMGHAVAPEDLKWQMWPTAAAGPNMIRKTDKPNAIEEISGSIARGTFSTGEPIQEAKLIKANGSGYMAAVLPKGMRAISTEISPETGAGGFILPGDHVDVILSRRDKEMEKVLNVETHVSETILKNVRVLAIDQTVEEKNGQKVVVGKTATLELAPRQTEVLALGRQRGTISLALRSIVDGSGRPEGGDSEDKGGVSIIRFGINPMTAPMGKPIPDPK
jgi:pilus assembly protein CpaB